MADTNPFSVDAWLQAQRSYWDAWSELTRQAFDYSHARTQTPNTWADGLQKWWEMVAPTAPPSMQDLYNRLVATGSWYLRILEEMGKAAPVASSQWQDLYTKTGDFMLAAFRNAPYTGSGQWFAPWQQGMAAWQQALTNTTPPLAADWLKGLFPQFPAATQLREQFQQYLRIPGVGFNRELQGQFQTLASLLLDYDAALVDFGNYIAEIAKQSTDHLQKMLGEREEPVQTGREWYNLWVDACEEVYADAALTEEYSKMYGRVTNTLMAVQRQATMMLDKTLAMMNLPNQREIETLQERMVALRRENRELRTGLVELRGEIDQLKQDKTARTSKAKTADTGGAAGA